MFQVITPKIHTIKIVTTGVPQVVGGTANPCRGFEFRVPSSNTADVSISWDGAEYMAITKGTSWVPKTLSDLSNQIYDLQYLVFKGTAGDLITIVYYML